MALVAHRFRRLQRCLAAALAALWCLTLAAGLSGVGGFGTSARGSELVAVSEGARHRASCSCRTCVGGKAGKKCCCLTARTPREGFALRALCDRNAPTSQSVIFLKVAMPTPPALRPPGRVPAPVPQPPVAEASPSLVPYAPEVPPPQTLPA
jgi:hypothetical protein